MNGTHPQSRDRYIPQQSLKSRAIKGKERGIAVGGCCSSVAERWWLKPEALGSIPGGATFHSFPLPFKGLQTVTAPIVFVRQSLSVSGLWGSPVYRLPMLWLRSPFAIMCRTATVLEGLFGEYHSSSAALDQQHWEVTKQPLVHDWWDTPEPVMMLNCQSRLIFLAHWDVYNVCTSNTSSFSSPMLHNGGAVQSVSIPIDQHDIHTSDQQLMNQLVPAPN